DGHTGADTINLPTHQAFRLVDYLFSAPAVNGADGASALPTITSVININGAGDNLFRVGDGSAAPFRFFDVARTGSLTLNNLALLGGLAKGSGVSAQGGAIYSQGTLALTKVTLQSNAATG